MKKILFILFLFSCFFAKAQYTVPRGFYTPNTSPFYYFKAPGGFVLIDSVLMINSSDTVMKPLYPAIKFKDNIPYYWDMSKWNAFGSGGGGGTLEDAYSAQGSTPFGAGYTIDFGGQDITHDNFGNYIVNSDNFIELTSGGGSILDINSSGTFAFQSGTGIYQFSNIPTITSPTYVASWNGNNLTQTLASDLIPGFGNDSIKFYVLDSLSTPPVSPATGDVYEVSTNPDNPSAWQDNATNIATWNGSSWDFTIQSIGDQLLNDANSIVSKWNGTAWVRVSRYAWFVGGNYGVPNAKLGTTNGQLRIIGNNRVGITIANTGVPQFNQITGASAGLAGLSTTGVVSNVQIGTGLMLSGGVLSSTASGSPLFPLIGTGTATGDVTGDLDGNSLTVANGARMTISLSDSMLIGATKISLAATDSANVRANVIYDKAATAMFGSNVMTNIHYETGTGDSLALYMKSTGMFLRGLAISTNASRKPLQIDTTTGKLAWKLINLSDATAQVTGTLAVGNGGTGATTLTANNLIVGNGTSAVTFIAPGTSGNILTSNGTTWVSSAAAAQVWSRGQYQALPSTNIVQPTTLTDTVAVGSGISTSLYGQFNVAGNASFRTNVAIGNFAPDASYRLKIGGTSSIEVTGNSRLEQLVSINTAADPVAGQALTIQGSTSSAITGTATQATNSTTYTGYGFTVQNSMTTAVGSNTAVFASINNLTDQSSTQTSALYRGVYSSINTQSNSSTPITTAVTFDSYIRGNSGANRTQTFTTVYGFRSQDILSAYPTGGMLTSGGNFYQYFADSSLAAAFAGGSMWGFYQRTNTANNIKNVFQGNTLIGTGTQDASAALQVKSTTQGFMPPVMTSTQASAIASPADGLLVYVTDTNGTFTAIGFWGRVSGAWAKLN